MNYLYNALNLTESSEYSSEYQEDPQLMNSIMEVFMVDECSHFTDEERTVFVESHLADTLVNEAKMRKRTIHRIGQMDDLKRRTALAAIEMGKAHNDPLYKKYRVAKRKSKVLLKQLIQKYQSRAGRAAKLYQKDYIRNRMPKQMPIANFGVR